MIGNKQLKDKVAIIHPFLQEARCKGKRRQNLWKRKGGKIKDPKFVAGCRRWKKRWKKKSCKLVFDRRRSRRQFFFFFL